MLIFAGTQGYLDDIPPAEVGKVCEKLLDYLEKMHRDTVFEKIKETGELSKEVEDKLRQATDEFKKL